MNDYVEYEEALGICCSCGGMYISVGMRPPDGAGDDLGSGGLGAAYGAVCP